MRSLALGDPNRSRRETGMNSSHLPLEHVHNRIHCIGASDSDSPHGRSLQTAATPSRRARGPQRTIPRWGAPPKCGIMHLGTRTHTSVTPYIISHRPTQQDFRPAAGQTQSHSPALLPCHCERREAIYGPRAKPRAFGFVSHTRPQRELPPRPAGPRPFPDIGRQLALFAQLCPTSGSPAGLASRLPCRSV